jgi:hypothetical protein
MGYVDRDGNWVLSPQFERAEPFCGGFALVKKNGCFYVINNSGDVTWEPNGDHAWQMYE